MKYILKITIIVTLLFSIKSFAQLDTLNYVKQFETNKANYIGQPFSKLLNEMNQIQPNLIWSSGSFKNKNNVINSRLNFCEKQFAFNNVITLLIEWDTPLSRSDTKYYEQLNHFYFTNDERNFYGSKIVKDIKVYR